jgi:hypothetical protein
VLCIKLTIRQVGDTWLDIACSRKDSIIAYVPVYLLIRLLLLGLKQMEAGNSKKEEIERCTNRIITALESEKLDLSGCGVLNDDAGLLKFILKGLYSKGDVSVFSPVIYLIKASVYSSLKLKNPEILDLAVDILTILADDSALVQFEKLVLAEMFEICATASSDVKDDPKIHSVALSTENCLTSLTGILLANGLNGGFANQVLKCFQIKSLFIPMDSKSRIKLSERIEYHPIPQTRKSNLENTALLANQAICSAWKSKEVGTAFDSVWFPWYRDRFTQANHGINLFPTREPSDAEERLLRKHYAVSFQLFFRHWLTQRLPFWSLRVSVFSAYSLLVWVVITHFTQRTLPSDSVLLRDMLLISFSAMFSITGLFLLLFLYPFVFGFGIHLGTSQERRTWKKYFAGLFIRPFKHLSVRFQGNQGVCLHRLALPGLGSMQNLKYLTSTSTAAIFETPAVRAMVNGMWSHFEVMFYLRTLLYLIHVLLFSVFGMWCVGKDKCLKSNDSFVLVDCYYHPEDVWQEEHVYNRTADILQEEQSADNALAVKYLICGYVSAVMGSYFLTREIMQCISCILTDGLIVYVDVWNVLQLIAHCLESISVLMFRTGGSPQKTKFFTVFAILLLWFNLLYYLRCVPSLSYLIQILTCILYDMIPFLSVISVLLFGVTCAFLVLLGSIQSNLDGHPRLDSIGSVLDLVVRIAEGRQDMESSKLLTILDNLDLSDESQLEIFMFSYSLFYLLFFGITIVGLNALISLMGSTFERVMEHKISYRSVY